MQVEGGVEFRPQLPFVCFFVRDVETTTRYSLRVFFFHWPEKLFEEI